MKNIKITVKIPEGLRSVLVAESERTGIGLQALAGQVLIHGYNDLMERKRQVKEAQDDVPVPESGE